MVKNNLLRLLQMKDGQFELMRNRRIKTEAKNVLGLFRESGCEVKTMNTPAKEDGDYGETLVGLGLRHQVRIGCPRVQLETNVD